MNTKKGLFIITTLIEAKLLARARMCRKILVCHALAISHAPCDVFGPNLAIHGVVYSLLFAIVGSESERDVKVRVCKFHILGENFLWCEMTVSDAHRDNSFTVDCESLYLETAVENQYDCDDEGEECSKPCLVGVVATR